MRNFLKNLNIVAGINVWSEGEICRFTIENVLNFCDKVVIAMDNPDEKTSSIIYEYAQKYPECIIAKKIDIPERDVRVLSGQIVGEGRIRQSLLDLIRIEHEKRPIDLLLLPDSDEIFTMSIQILLENFVRSNFDTVFIKPIEVYDSFFMIVDRGLCHHARIYKYRPDISANPYGERNYYLPYRMENNFMREWWFLVHLARLTKDNRDLRSRLRDRVTSPDLKMWRIDKPAYELTKQECARIFSDKNFITLKDYKEKFNEDVFNVPEMVL